jgi:O-antigen/teichoic acid export membrane protein
MNRLEISGKLLARNTLINFVGQVIPLAIGVIAIPFIVRGLGTDRFGLLSLAWVVLGYFAIFDLGLGRATTKYVAEALGKGEWDQVPGLVWATVTIQLILGLLGAIILVSITPLLVGRALNIPQGLIGEARITFYLLALSIPVTLVSSSFSGVLEARQRFDLVNSIRIPSSACTFLMPLVGLMLGLKLPGIVVLILGVRFSTLIAFLAINIRIFPNIKKFAIQRFLFLRLFKFGGWVTVSNIVSPVLTYLDRFLIGAILSITAVAFYTAPYEVVTRLWIIPYSLTITLFPAFSALERDKDRERIGIFFFTSVRYVFITLGPTVLFLIIFGKKILQIWLGADFALQSTIALQILAIGVLINSLAHVPYSLLQGIGRPDISAKFHLLELPFHFLIAWILINLWGITGAALAWAIRVTLDAFLLFAATFKVLRLSPRLLISNGLLLKDFSASGRGAVFKLTKSLLGSKPHNEN